MDDARLGRRPGALARQEDVPDLGLAVVELHALVRGAAFLVEDHPLWPRAGDMHGDRGGPRDADGCRRGGGSRLCQEGEEEPVEQEVAEAVGTDVELVALGVDAALGRMHDLRVCQRDRIHLDGARALCLWARGDTYTGIVHENVKACLLSSEGAHRGLDRGQVGQVEG